jgi:hypothetical protein
MPNKKIREKQLKLCNIFDSSEIGRDYSDIGQNLPGSSLPCRNLPKNPRAPSSPRDLNAINY